MSNDFDFYKFHQLNVLSNQIVYDSVFKDLIYKNLSVEQQHKLNDEYYSAMSNCIYILLKRLRQCYGGESKDQSKCLDKDIEECQDAINEYKELINLFKRNSI